jgi:predicted DNA-binding transcriptional regulator AlpA
MPGRPTRNLTPPASQADVFTKLHTIPDVQKILGCSRMKIYRLYQLEQLKLVKFGGLTRITDASLQELISGKTLPPAVLRGHYTTKAKDPKKPCPSAQTKGDTYAKE